MYLRRKAKGIEAAKARADRKKPSLLFFLLLDNALTDILVCPGQAANLPD